jgi:hypothetical protein
VLALFIIIGLIILLTIASMLTFSICVKSAISNEGFSYCAIFHLPLKIFGIGICKDKQRSYTQFLYGDKCLYERESHKKTRKKQKKEKTKKKKKANFSLFWDTKLFEQLIKAGLKFIRNLLFALHRPRVAGDVEIGFSDPAATGMLSAFLYSMSPNGILFDNLKIRPNYVDIAFTGKVDFSTGVRPARITIELIKLLFNLPIKKLFRLYKRRKKGSKEKEN